MPFRLKNARATDQRLVKQTFKDEIEKLVDVYVNEILVNRPNFETHIEDLMRAFEIFRQTI